MMTWHDFTRGFRALLPLWLGAAPFALAYAVTARAAGLTSAETQLMSLTVFSAGVQLSTAGLLGAGAASPTLLLMTFVLTVHQLLLGISLGRLIPLSGSKRLLAAYFLTDGAYGVTIASSTRTFSFLLGAELSMFVVWNVCTWLGVVLGQQFSDPKRLGVDFVVPLTFLALLIPLLRSRADLFTALWAGLIALVAGRLWPSSIAVLIATVLGSLGGACWTRPDTTALEAIRSEKDVS
jgi:predicted branched-subunit amino acid permease